MERGMEKALLIVSCLVQLMMGQSLLEEQKYAINIRYQTIPGDDPILHFTIRTYVPQSESFFIEYNISGVFNGEPYSNGGSDSESSSAFRPETEHIWHTEYHEEEMREGDTVLYWIKVEAQDVFYESIVHQATIGQEAPTSLEKKQGASATSTTLPPPTTQRVTAPAPTTRRVSTQPATPPTTRRTPPPPTPAPTTRKAPSSPSSPSTHRATAPPTRTTARTATPALPSPTSVRPPAATVRQPAATSRPPQQTPPAPRQFLPATNIPLVDVNSPSATTATSTDAGNVHLDIYECLKELGYSNYMNCTQRLYNSGNTTQSVATTTTTVQPSEEPKSSTTQAIITTQPKNAIGNKDKNVATDGDSDSKGGDSSGKQANTKHASSAGMDRTTVIVATVVPAIVMVGLIVIVTIIVKNRRARTEPDPYQQVFHNMNYNSTMEIGGRPGLPPPRGPFQKPTEETDYTYPDSNDIYEAITHVDYDLHGQMIKPCPPSMTSSQKSSIKAKTATEWGSDEYEDPSSPTRTSLKSRPNSMRTFAPNNNRPVSTVIPNSTYGLYQDPALKSRSTLPKTTVANAVYSDTYQDPASQHGHTLPATMSAAAMPEHIYNDTYQDPEQNAPTSPPVVEDSPQQLYEVPENEENSNRQYVALQRDESGVTLY